MQDLSFWAWGQTARLPDAAARAALAQQAAFVLGGAELVPCPIPALADIELPEPRIAVPELGVPATADKAERARHTYGRAYPDVIRGLRGDFGPAPDAVLFPEEEAHVQAVLAWASDADVAVVPFGGGTSVVGGVECTGADRAGVVALDLTRMDRVLEVDPISLAARIQAGARGPVLEEQLAPHGLTLRHFPQSFELSTLGGWIATRAGGHFATVYTHIDDLVESVRMVTPAGVFATARLPASGAGPDPNRLVLGSEGALGVITEAWMRVFPRPRWRGKASVAFAEWAPSVAATRAIAQARLYPANCRLLDPREALLHGVPSGGRPVLLLGLESADHPVRAGLERALAIARDHGGAILDGPTYSDTGARANSEAGDAWRAAFLDAPYRASAAAVEGLLVDTFETACTWDRFDALHADVVASVEAALGDACGGGWVTARFTHVYPDGPAPYYTFLGAARRGAEVEQWQAVKAAASEALLRHGATITHHHAVGRTHKRWVALERPALFADVLRGAKERLDPAGVLNPGVLM